MVSIVFIHYKGGPPRALQKKCAAAVPTSPSRPFFLAAGTTFPDPLAVPEAHAIPAAELRGVTKRFGPGAPALESLDLAAREGEFLTLLGPSGCGKTTALRLFSGLETPDAGTVWLAGRDVTALPPYRREVNQVFQSYALFPHLSVADNITFGLRMQRLSRAETAARLARAVELTALDGLLARQPAQLSGGQRQRVALARALVCEPRVLLLDEPLSALDARLRAQVRGELRALQRRLGRTFIFVTHDQEEALTLSDRVAVMRAGRVEQIGGVEDIYHRPANRFVAGFVGEANLLEAEIAGQEDGMVCCRLRDGDILFAAGTPPPANAVTLMVRPERVRLRTEPPAVGERNVWAVRVVERVFQGAGTTLTLEREDTSLRLRALASHEARMSAVPEGAALYACVAPEDVVVLRD